ncbi:MAG: carboxypeptidase regulatory-like domain-containing protein [Pyrinomonadaceae bacterium]|nr:carboxypeptidase regulatory-like domain-containing protein [Pyrinomonadaceae bacterium]
MLKKLFAFCKLSSRQIIVEAVCAVFICAFSQTVFAQTELFKTSGTLLRGADSVNELRENGQYESLINAVNESRYKNAALNNEQNSTHNFSALTPDYVLETRTTSGDGLFDDRFGISVSLSGNTAVVGAYLDDVNANMNQGSAYVYVRTGNIWLQQAQLTAADGATEDLFGNSVAINGNTIIVGANRADIGTNGNQGAAYIFTRSGTTWTQQAKIVAGDGESGDNFGYSVAISGETVAIGAFADSFGTVNFRGSAYIFTRSLTDWSQQAKIVANDGAANDQFGISVSISGNSVVVGAFLDDTTLNTDQGSAYVFTRSGTTWTQQALLQAPIGIGGGAASDRFGISVAISGETIIVGAFLDDVGTIAVNSNQGSAYIFTRSGTTWTQQTQLFASDGAADDRFGASVAIDGDVAVVGAIFDDVAENFDQGSAYVFERTGTTWTQKTQITDTSGSSNDMYATTVAISGGKIAVGSPNNETTPFAGFGGDSTNIANAVNALDQGSVLFYANVPAGVTSAGVTIGGRVTTGKGRGIPKTNVYLTDANGQNRTTQTNAFGYYRFANTTAGQTFILTAVSKRYTFDANVVTATEDLANVDFIVQP